MPSIFRFILWPSSFVEAFTPELLFILSICKIDVLIMTKI